MQRNELILTALVSESVSSQHGDKMQFSIKHKPKIFYTISSYD
jgi:hypothetical protein